MFSVTLAPAAGEGVQSYLREVRDSVAAEYRDRAEEVAGLLLDVRAALAEQLFIQMKRLKSSYIAASVYATTRATRAECTRPNQFATQAWK